jgi:hypothetical protein
MDFFSRLILKTPLPLFFVAGEDVAARRLRFFEQAA